MAIVVTSFTRNTIRSIFCICYIRSVSTRTLKTLFQVLSFFVHLSSTEISFENCVEHTFSVAVQMKHSIHSDSCPYFTKTISRGYRYIL